MAALLLLMTTALLPTRWASPGMLGKNAALLPARLAPPVMLAKKPKTDPRSWLPARSSPFGREVDVALQLVSRAAPAASEPALVASIVSQALVSDGLQSEFPADGIIAPNTAASLAGHDEQAILDLCNTLGATQPCVNAFDPPYPVPVAATKLDAATLATALEWGSATGGLPPRAWLLASIAEAAQPAISLTLLEYGRPVVGAANARLAPAFAFPAVHHEP